MKRSAGIVGGAVGFVLAAAGTALVADRRLDVLRRSGRADADRFVDPPADRTGLVIADDGIALYYEENGPMHAPLTVVFAHGFCLNRNDFRFQRMALLEEFGDRIRMVSYDHRSHGKSGHSQAQHATMDQLGADLHTLIGERVPRGPIVLVGHSMGGMTVLSLADAHPRLFGPRGRIRGVVLVSTSTGRLATVTFGLPAALARVGGPVLPIMLRGARRQAAMIERGRARLTGGAWVFVRRLAFGGPVDPALVEYLTGLIGATPVDVIADFYPTLIDHDKLSALDRLATTQVRVICGERDLLTPPEHSVEIAACLPDAELTIVPETGHQVLMERPEQVSEPIIELAQQLLDELAPSRRPSRRPRP